jgi:hypothetical protein
MEEAAMTFEDMERLTVTKFRKVLRAELEHLIEHIDLLITHYDSLAQERKTTEHVCRENTALFQNERQCFCHFIRILDDLRLAPQARVDAYAEALRCLFRREVKDGGYAKAALVFAERKIDKVRHYVTE